MTKYETARRTLERKLAATSPHNRALVQEWISYRSEVDDIRPTTQSLKATAMWRFDQFVKSKPFDQVEDSDFVAYRKFIAGRYRTGDSQGQYLHHVSNFFLWRLGDRIGRISEIRYLLIIRNAAPSKPKRRLSPQEVDHMIELCDRKRDKAVIATLADSGLRAEELLSLNVGSYATDPDGVSWLELPPTAEALKKGPREVAVMRCPSELNEWLAEHPIANDPAAPLFTGVNAHAKKCRMSYTALRTLIAGLAKSMGLENVSSHSFRRTRAREALRNRWSLAEANKHFGWKGAKMFLHYGGEVDRQDMAARIKQDVGRSAASNRVEEPGVEPSLLQAPSSSKPPTIAELLAQALLQGLNQPAPARSTKKDPTRSL